MKIHTAAGIVMLVMMLVLLVAVACTAANYLVPVPFICNPEICNYGSR